VRRASRSTARWWIAATAAIGITGPIAPGPADAFQATPRPKPRIPGAATRPPDGIGPGAPFDVPAFFAAPPPELNAAPLYLDALFEFGPEPAVCFLEGAETTQRKQVAERRIRAIDDLFFAFRKDPATVSNQAIEELVAELEPALRKVEDAQRRPRCVFDLPLDTFTPLPHVEPAQRVARLVAMKTSRCLDRGEVAQPLHDLEVVLRLTRDLRPRGSLICQIIATSIGEIAMSQIIPALLASPALRDEHARRLIDLLRRHEAASIDGYQEGMRFEYIVLRHNLAIIEKDPRQISKVLGSPNPATGERDANAEGLAFNFQLQLMLKPIAFAELNARIDEYFRDLLAFDRPLAQWPREQLHPKRIWDAGLPREMAAILLPSGESLALFQARSALGLRAAECLIALRLWKSRSKELPKNLEAVVKAAGLPRVPIDPYSGQPIRMAIIDGEPVIYSVGRDGRDDGGRIDSDSDRNPGDQTFRLPAIEKRKP
jgi:hypothetical protein